jgi:hypothetical protein
MLGTTRRLGLNGQNVARAQNWRTAFSCAYVCKHDREVWQEHSSERWDDDPPPVDEEYGHQAEHANTHRNRVLDHSAVTLRIGSLWE